MAQRHDWHYRTRNASRRFARARCIRPNPDWVFTISDDSIFGMVTIRDSRQSESWWTIRRRSSGMRRTDEPAQLTHRGSRNLCHPNRFCSRIRARVAPDRRGHRPRRPSRSRSVPKGRNVGLGLRFGAPIITHDGERSPRHRDQAGLVNLGAQLATSRLPARPATLPAATAPRPPRCWRRRSCTKGCAETPCRGCQPDGAEARHRGCHRGRGRGAPKARHAGERAWRRRESCSRGRRPEMGELVGEAMDHAHNARIQLDEEKGVTSEIE